MWVLQNISDQRIGDRQHFIKSDPEEVWQLFVDGNNHTDKTNTYVKSRKFKPPISRWNKALSEK